jgi:hypothetical protein
MVHNIIQPEKEPTIKIKKNTVQPIKSILSNKKKLGKESNFVHETRSEINTTDIFDMIPDIIHLSSNVEEDSDIITTFSPQTNQHA